MIKRWNEFLLENKLVFNSALLLKIDSIDIKIPDEPNGAHMTKLPSDKIHVTLTSIKNSKSNKTVLNVLPDVKLPEIKYGEGKFVYRDDKITYVLPIINQVEFKSFVDSIYQHYDLINPEPDRFYHITVANNANGDPFKSIGDVNKKDFEL